MLKAGLLLALLSTGTVESASVPPGTILVIRATVCYQESDMDKIVDAEVRTGAGEQVFATLDGCNNYCIRAKVVREERRFFMKQSKQLFAVFEVRGLTDFQESLWATTAILPSGWPVPVPLELHAARCQDQIPAV